MNELAIAVLGGLVVLGVQALGVLYVQWRKRVNAGEVDAGPAFSFLRRLSTLGRRKRVRKVLAEAAARQRTAIVSQQASDPLWGLGQIRIERATATDGGDVVAQTLSEVLDDRADGERDVVLVRGESGSGKSSLAAHTAANWSGRGVLVLRFDLSGFDRDRGLLDQLASDDLRVQDLEIGLALDDVGLILDGFESIEGDDQRKVFDAEITKLLRRYPGTRIAVLARPDVLPTRRMLKSRAYRVRPLTIDDVETTLRSVDRDASWLRDGMDDRVRVLCSSPLGLRMLIQAYSDSGELPSNDSVLYSDFVDALLRSGVGIGDAQSTITADVKRELLAEVALDAANRITTISHTAARQVLDRKLTELKSQYRLQASVGVVEVIGECLADGIIRADERALRFVHYSVQEFLAAEALANRLDSGEVAIGDVIGLATQQEWYHSIVFLSGLLPDSTEMVRDLRERNRVLAAECIKTANRVQAELVDQCIVEALYEFKFGQMSFNYDLVFALMHIADRRSPDLPDRIIDEMGYWCRKYVARPLSELSGIESEALLGLLESRPLPPEASDAVWTLGVRRFEPAVPVLENFLRSREEPLARVSALALGKLGQRTSAQLLLATALDTDAPDPLRSSCFNSVGMVKAKECLPAIIEFIRSGQELEGTVRENAAWALIGLVDGFLMQDPDFQDLIVSQLRVGRPYAQAMFAYLAGRYLADDGLDRLMDIAGDSTTDYLVMEDVVFAIGEYRDERARPLLVELLEHPDNVVRARVIEAIGKLGTPDDDEMLVNLADEESSEIARAAARKAAGLNLPDPVTTESTWQRELRRRR